VEQPPNTQLPTSPANPRHVDIVARIGEAGAVRATIVQRRWLCLWAIVLAAVASSCGSGSDDEVLVVLAASSLTDVLQPIADDYTISTGVPVELSFAGSSTLREQILEGAPADVFISANVSIMAEIAQIGLIRESIEPVATNAIVLAVPDGNPGGIVDLSSLEDGDAIVGLCSAEVPCGQLGQAVLEAEGVAASVDTFEPSVRALLAKIEIGEVDAGLVYDTDVRSSDNAVAIGPPFSQVGETTYVAASLLGSGSNASRFVDFLGGDLARSSFADAGFGMP